MINNDDLLNRIKAWGLTCGASWVAFPGVDLADAPTNFPSVSCPYDVAYLLVFRTEAGGLFVGCACDQHQESATDWVIPILGLFDVGLTIMPVDQEEKL